MHEIILAKEILNEVLKQVKKNKLKTVSRVIIELGRNLNFHEKISLRNLKYSFKILAKDDFLKKAKFCLKYSKNLKGWRLKEIHGK
jgi:Zn finger protein HypA/HybF involved in hydrogenase expression